MAAPREFDVVVIGAGPGGYIAAIRAAQLGLSTACIDEWKNDKGGPAPGGTCTNVGCIPSKALLQSSENFDQAGHHFADHGIGVGSLTIDVEKMMARKRAVVKQNNDGILYLFKKNKVQFFHGRGSFAGKAEGGGWSVAVDGPQPQTLAAKHVIVATGSSARALPGAAFDERTILSNDGALALGEVPKTLGIVGSGVIGLEMGSVWRRLGAEVTILEALPTFLGAVDTQIAAEAQKVFTKQGMKIALGVKIGAVATSEGGVTVSYADAGGAAQSLACERLIVSIGRVPNTAGLNAEAVGLGIDERGSVIVDADCRTGLENVWAIGDVVRGPMLAHKAEEEGVAVAERIAGQKPHVDFNTVPWVIYTSPEIAWVGRTEQQLKADGRAYRAGSFPFMANGRARALGDTTGMVKMLADAKTDEILGVHVIGPMASELIAEAVVAMEFKASAEDLARICHAHPSLSEATKEAALAVDKRALNSEPATVAVRELYERTLAERGFRADAAQLRAIDSLERCENEWATYKSRRSNAITKLIARPPIPRGVYMWGGVGRGKSFLMDCFFNAVPLQRKTRLHFHEFMREVHRELAEMHGTSDPLLHLGKSVARRFRLICLDEFHVADITDAMILHRLLESLFAHRVSIVTTSNFPPDGLYPNGLHRDRILPAIALLEDKLEVVGVDGGVDYRHSTLQDVALYHTPLGADADAAMQSAFERLAEARDESPLLRIERREIRARRRAGGVVWFDFRELCGGPRSQNDYLELATQFHTLLLSGVPQMSPRLASEARRFTWLVDVLYDRRVKLIVSAAVEPEALYTEGPLVHEFPRTVSRLREMRSTEFLAESRRIVDTSLT